MMRSEDDDFIDEIMNQLKDDDMICVQKGGPLNQEEVSILQEDHELVEPLHIIESADVVLEDGLNISDVVGQEIVLADISFNQIENNNSLTEQRDASLLSRNINSKKELNKSDFIEKDPDDPDFVFDTSEDDSCHSEHYMVLNEDPEEQNEITNEACQILEQETQTPLGDETHGLLEGEPQQVEENVMRKKRKRNKKPVPSEWEVNQQKRLRMTGKKYVGFTRKKEGEKMAVKKSGGKEERKLEPRCNSRICNANKKRRCSEFSEDYRNTLFKDFWALSWSEKATYVKSFTTKTKPKRRTVANPNNSRRTGTFAYFLRHEGENKPVCKKFFLNTLSIKEWMAHNWYDKKTEEVPTDDVHSNAQPTEGSTNNTQEGSRYGKKSEKEKVIEEWFDCLPKVPSHYCRRSSTKLYLEPVWDSKRAMYNEYKNHTIAKNKPWGSLTMFMSIFDRKNLSIYVPKKDQCDTCSAYKVGNISKEKYDEHQKQKERAREEKEKDKQQAIEEKIHCLTVDVEAVKLTPITRASAMYYKTKLCSHNYTVYNLATKHCTCYWFNEVEGDLSGNTFASCIAHYLKEYCINPLRPIVIYSDGATNQNRNQILSNSLLHFAVQNNVKITQKCLIKGHTHMEGDFVHAKIEEKLKGQEVYVPHEFVRYTQEARQKPFPYNTEYLTHVFYKDFRKISYYDSIRPGRSCGDPVVVDIHCLEYDFEEMCIKYKLNFEDDFKLCREGQPK